MRWDAVIEGFESAGWGLVVASTLVVVALVTLTAAVIVLWRSRLS